MLRTVYVFGKMSVKGFEDYNIKIPAMTFEIVSLINS